MYSELLRDKMYPIPTEEACTFYIQSVVVEGREAIEQSHTAKSKVMYMKIIFSGSNKGNAVVQRSG